MEPERKILYAFFPFEYLLKRDIVLFSDCCTRCISCCFLLAAAVYIQLCCQQGPGQFCWVCCLLPSVSTQPFLSFSFCCYFNIINIIIIIITISFSDLSVGRHCLKLLLFVDIFLCKFLKLHKIDDVICPRGLKYDSFFFNLFILNAVNTLHILCILFSNKLNSHCVA